MRLTKPQYANKVKILMGKQYNKEVKRKRRQKQIKRKKETAKVKKTTKSKAKA